MMCSAAALAVGCVSSGTWSALDQVEAELARDARELRERPEEEARGEEAALRAESCDALALQVLASHPSLDAVRARARAALAEARAEGALPAPELMLEVWDFPIGDPAQADREGMYMLGFMQALPPGGALDGRARAAVEDARASLGELAEQRRELRAEASLACTDWAEARAVDERLAASDEVLSQMSDALRARLASSGDALSDLARIDAERARVRRLRAEVEAERRGAEARLAALLGGRGSLEVAEAPELPVLEAEVDRGALIERALAARGALDQARSRSRAAAARADAAEAEASVPMFRVGASYMQMPGARPGLGVSLSMTLPWLWSGEGSARDAAKARADAEIDGARAIERRVQGEIARALAALETASGALTALREQERPALERAMGAIARRYASGGVDLLAWLDAARALRELEVEEARLRAAAARAWVDLEGAVGEPLEPGGVVRAGTEPRAEVAR